MLGVRIPPSELQDRTGYPGLICVLGTMMADISDAAPFDLLSDRQATSEAEDWLISTREYQASKQRRRLLTMPRGAVIRRRIR